MRGGSVDECWIGDVSSLNLRTFHRGSFRSLKNPLKFTCSVCGKKKLLGKSSSAMMRCKYVVGEGGLQEAWVCDVCLDIVVDALRYGPKVIRELHNWKRKSRVIRVSYVEDELMCFFCREKSGTHLFMKFDDMSGGVEHVKTIRACSTCILSYMLLMKGSEELARRKFKRLQVVNV